MTLSQLEFRIKSLEKKFADLTGGRTSPSQAEPNAWIDQIHGTFQNDHTYRQAARLGRKWRKSVGSAGKPRSRKAASK